MEEYDAVTQARHLKSLKQSPLLEVPPQQPGSVSAASQLFSCAWLPMGRLARDSYSLLLLPRRCCGLQGVASASCCPELSLTQI